jgi:hypothetical protein
MALLLPIAAAAQLLPNMPIGPVGPVGPLIGGMERVGRDTIDTASGTADRAVQSAATLARDRVDRLRDIVRAAPRLLEMTKAGPAVKGEIVATGASPAAIEAALAAGFRIAGRETIQGLDIEIVTLHPPSGWSVDKAMTRLARIGPDFAPNYLYQLSGTGHGGSGAARLAGGGGAARIGIVDGGVAAHPSLGPVEQKGFAAGAPAPSPHGTAIASLAVGRVMVRGAAPGAGLLVADVYGRDPKGGNAVAIARALGMMAERRIRVVAMSLVGPPNPLLARAIGQLRALGIAIVAPVGNDGPAAPPAFPASYPGVIAVTAVDGRNRPLAEAGRALHVDFAAPGADMAAASPDGTLRAVRGTSYAVPLIAGLLLHISEAQLAAQAKPIGRNAGHGLVCGDCRTALPKR